MPKHKKDPIQEALKELLANPRFNHEVATYGKIPEVAQALSAAVKNLDIEALCDYLRHNATQAITPLI